MPSPLDVFHPLIRDWFEDSIGRPTDVQGLAWPKIAAGEHVLISAPTGSGKTLTAFLWALNQLFTGQWEPGKVRVLYISPLRALNTDIRRNLERPLAELGERFRLAGEEAPGIRAATRSGDTSTAERQRMIRRPPEILVTTPESLNILLTSKSGRSLLTHLETVIVDEIHAVTASKRGTHLITAVDRLVPLAGEFQRVALSATIKPMEVIAEFVGGFRLRETEGGYAYDARQVAIVRSKASKEYRVKVRYPLAISAVANDEEIDEDNLWELLVDDFRKVIRRNRSTLLFANSRRMTEKVTRLINQGQGEDLAYSHHGSLSREVRAVVEKRLKEGELKAIVATNSLELGIDIGALDEVILIQTPRAISSSIQRVGRAGHGVGEVSRGVFYPTHGRDFLDAAVVVRSILDQDIEEVQPITAPLDVLAQVVLSMVVAEPWNVDDLHAALLTSYPYRHLKRRQLDLVIDMLTGRYADSRIRDLRPRVTLDRVDNTLKARPGVARVLYMAGGTIADRGYFALRLEDSMAKLGELDEEFVWERSVGDTFALGAQSWQIRKVTHNDVLVRPARRAAAMPPFWRADQQDRDYHFSRKVAHFLGASEDRLEDPNFAEELRHDYHLESAATEQLLEYLRSQKAATGRLPGSRRLIAEHTEVGADDGRQQVILHTFWGGTVNRPLSIALRAAWDEREDEAIEVYHDDDCLLLRIPRGLEVREVLSAVDPEHLETLLRQRLEQTGFFGARFRVNASTALLLPRAGFRHRTPLWMHRQRSKKLLEAVAPYGDFPIMVETWRTCLQDDLDLVNLKRELQRFADDEIELIEVRTRSPSPFAAGLMWRHTNQFMYADDTPEATGASKLRQDLLQELVFSSHLRPRLPRQLVVEFEHKVQRVAPGYAPRAGDDLVHWLSERVLVPESEWRELLAAIERDHEVDVSEILESVEGRALRWVPPRAATASIIARDSVPRLARALDVDLDRLALTDLESTPLGEAAFDVLREMMVVGDGEDSEDARWSVLGAVTGEWASFYGPFLPDRISDVFGLPASELRQLLELLQDSQRVVIDQLTPDAETPEVCDARNLETLLRWLRVSRRPSFEVQPSAALPLFLASHQGLVERGDGVEGLQDRLERLFGYSAPVAVWETEILPARLDPYYPAWLDSLMQESDLGWLGSGKTRLTFAFSSDFELFREVEGSLDGGEVGSESSESSEEVLHQLFGDGNGKHDLGELAARSGWSTSRVSEELWRLAWEGRVHNDSFLAVRKASENKFQVSEAPSRRTVRSSRRASFNRWKAKRPYFGNWSVIEADGLPGDALEEDELAKDRIRVLLQRYGILFRELLARELPALRWARVFRALRLMELSGEVLAGHFFEGIPGLQFLSHSAMRQLRNGLPRDAIFWLSAADPASLAGVAVEGLKGELPSRLASNHLVYHGQRLVMISKRRGRELEVRCLADHPHLGDYFQVLKVFLTREVQPMSSVDVETINGEPAVKSPYADKLGEIFRVSREPRALKLWKHY